MFYAAMAAAWYHGAEIVCDSGANVVYISEDAAQTRGMCQRSIFISRYWHAGSISDIAVRHGMKDGAVSMV